MLRTMQVGLGTALALLTLLATPAASGQPVVPISPAAGMPRPWEEGLQVSPYSVVNLVNGNLITVIPLTACDPVGPPLVFTLYHNSANAATGLDGIPSPWGFDLGDGWSVSYGGCVVGKYGDETVSVIEDDGNEYFFEFESQNGDDFLYSAPVGKYDILWYDYDLEQWILTRPSQEKRYFDYELVEVDENEYVGLGRLVAVEDSAGSVLHIERDPDHDFRIDAIRSAADQDDELGESWHRITLDYDEGVRPKYIEDPIGRVWTLGYDAQGRLETITHPTDQYVTTPETTVVEYLDTDLDHIKKITDRTGQSWEFAYQIPGNETLAQVTDLPTDQQDPHVQTFSWAKHIPSGFWRTTHTDRRGKVWKYDFDDDNNYRRRVDPLNGVRRYTYGTGAHLHDMLEFKNELNKSWTYTYGPVGNVLTVSSPLDDPPDQTPDQTWTYTWTQPDSELYPNLYVMTQATDPLGHWVQYAYGDDDPTLVTTITEQDADGSYNPGAVTTLAYWHAEDPGEAYHAIGQLRLVTDANGVEHYYEYDWPGYMTQETEGLFSIEQTLQTEFPLLMGPFDIDDVGRVTGAPGGSLCVDVNGNAQCVRCGPYDLNGPGDPIGLRLGLTDIPLPDGLCGRLEGGFDSLNGDVEYDAEGRPLLLKNNIDLGDLYTGNFRQQEFAYDGFGRVSSQTTTSAEVAWEDTNTTIVTGFEYTSRDADGRVLEREDHNSNSTFYEYDDVGRLHKLRLDDAEQNPPTAVFTYDAAGRLTVVDYANGAQIVREYDDADRLLCIKHKDLSGTIRQQTDYVWNDDNTVDQRTETDATDLVSSVAVVDFEYDARGRLTRETRTVDQTPAYDFSYTYDGLGNRLTKTDNLTDVFTKYYYDSVEENRDPAFPTNNNRLLKYEIWEDAAAAALGYQSGEPGGEPGSGDPEPAPHQEPPDPPRNAWRTVWYTYYQNGHVANITIRDAREECQECDRFLRQDLALYYNGNGSLWIAVWDHWTVDEDGYVADSYGIDAGREFRFDSPRARYLARNLDPATLTGQSPTVMPLSPQHWTMYDGDSPYLDFDVDDDGTTMTQTDTKQYVAGLAELDLLTSATSYLHGDLLRSLVMTTDDEGGVGVSPATFAYTAFGEPAGAADPLAVTRYTYAGGWGYEAGLIILAGQDPDLPPITLSHVGARWYQPDIGRFVQRDPAGLAGGLNTYLYADNDPLSDDDSGVYSDMIGVWIKREIERLVGRWTAIGNWATTTAFRAAKTQSIYKFLRKQGERRAYAWTIAKYCAKYGKSPRGWKGMGTWAGYMCVTVTVCELSAEAAHACDDWITRHERGITRFFFEHGEDHRDVWW